MHEADPSNSFQIYAILASGVRCAIAPDHEHVSRWAAELILAELEQDPRLLLGCATGSTPTRTYELVVESLARNVNIAPDLRILQVDEWGGLPAGDPATCETYLRQRLLAPLHIPPARFLGWSSDPPEPQAECNRFERRLADEGPIDLCVLGLGANGHLAFNEPADALRPYPHVATLSAPSLQHTMLRAATATPTFGLTIGMSAILQSRHVLLLVSGKAKAAPVAELMTYNVNTHFPASFLWLHPRVTILLDEAAAGT
jgi:galactosamine-6-phosphate isomerase